MNRKKKGIVMSVVGAVLLLLSLVFGVLAVCNAYVPNEMARSLAGLIGAIATFSIGLCLLMGGLTCVVIGDNNPSQAFDAVS